MNPVVKSLLKPLLRPLDICIPAEVDGHRWRMPVVRGQTGGYRNLTEPWMSDVLKRLFQLAPDSAFMDVGVNMGQTLVKVMAISRDIPYVGFEPNPYCVQYVRRFIEENRLPHCEIVPIALGDAAGVATFFMHEADDQGATIVSQSRQAQSSTQRQHVPVFALDELPGDLLPTGTRIAKIDVEGAELATISGMRKFIERQRPWIVCEVLHADSPQRLEAVGEKNTALMRLLRECGYVVHRLVKAPKGVALQGIEPVETFSEGVFRGDLSPQLCDYLFVPQQAVAETRDAFGLATSA
jgi:FkbM family methyltransferase